jgi:hypothetical protein
VKDTTPNESFVTLPSVGADLDHFDPAYAKDPRFDQTIRVIAPGPLLPPKPRVLNRRADDTAYMSPEVLRSKLLQVGYRAQTVTQPTPCAVDGCNQLTIDTVCWECQVHIDARTEDARLRRERRRAAVAFWPATLTVIAVLGLLFYAASQAGVLLRTWGWL